MTLSPVKAEKTVHFTSPPKPFNEDTLLAAMETAGNKDFDSETEKKGLGTPATRAGIIENWFLPAMQSEKESRSCQAQRAGNW